MDAFIGGVHSSGWLRHIHSILETSLTVARNLQQGVNVLVHCSDGLRLPLPYARFYRVLPHIFIQFTFFNRL